MSVPALLHRATPAHDTARPLAMAAEHQRAARGVDLVEQRHEKLDLGVPAEKRPGGRVRHGLPRLSWRTRRHAAAAGR